jgi:dihydroorotate dehydrogenase (NAD+) catalytic subunit
VSVSFCGIELAHPVINGSGTFDAIAGRRAFGEALYEQFPFAAYVSKTITLEARAGNPPPRLWESGQGLINSIGLPNKGLERFCELDLPQYRQLPVPLIVSVMGFSSDALERILDRLEAEPDIAAIELNLSCPNVKTGTIVGADAGETSTVVKRLRPRTRRPLIAKLSPATVAPETVALAAAEAGCDAVSLVNTFPAMALDPVTGRPWLGGGSGGLSGPAIKPIALAQVRRVADAVDVPVVGMGGVETATDAAEFLACGATLVAVGTANFRNPLAAQLIADELAAPA